MLMKANTHAYCNGTPNCVNEPSALPNLDAPIKACDSHSRENKKHNVFTMKTGHWPLELL